MTFKLLFAAEMILIMRHSFNQINFLSKFRSSQKKKKKLNERQKKSIIRPNEKSKLTFLIWSF